MSTIKNSMPSKNLELYDKLLQSSLNPNIERKGKTLPYTSLNGHMFSFLSKEGLVGLRLSESDREQFIKEFDSRLMEQHGIVMKEYVEVPHALLVDAKMLKKYLLKSYEYVAGLAPKSTKRS
ncbi:MAG: hypothetical protein PHU08_01205 [Dehalococcoidales bacterium]|nr:hypothetical protein [Dehalococcoidales bacterium]